MANLTQGRAAEQAAADFLKQQGFKIKQLNWRTRFCEIDIVAEKQKRIYFIEVKYRLSDAQGLGLEYITPAKLKKMRFAAEVWVKANRWPGDYSIGAAEVSGPNFAITNLLEEIDVL